jgi:hypothetical protein
MLELAVFLLLEDHVLLVLGIDGTKRHYAALKRLTPVLVQSAQVVIIEGDTTCPMAVACDKIPYHICFFFPKADAVQEIYMTGAQRDIFAETNGYREDIIAFSDLLYGDHRSSAAAPFRTLLGALEIAKLIFCVVAVERHIFSQKDY